MEPAILETALAAVLLLVHIVAAEVATWARVERKRDEPMNGGQTFGQLVPIAGPLLDTAAAIRKWRASAKRKREDGLRNEPTDEGRILKSYLETLPAFALVLIAAELSGRGNDWILFGGWLWLAGRVVYLPVYATKPRWVGAIVWVVATLGVVVMLVGLALGPA